MDKDTKIYFRVSSEFKEYVTDIANKLNVSMSAFIMMCINNNTNFEIDINTLPLVKKYKEKNIDIVKLLEDEKKRDDRKLFRKQFREFKSLGYTMHTLLKELFIFCNCGHDLKYLHNHLDNYIGILDTYENTDNLKQIILDLKTLNEEQLKLFVNNEFNIMKQNKKIQLSMIARIKECRFTYHGVTENIKIEGEKI